MAADPKTASRPGRQAATPRQPLWPRRLAALVTSVALVPGSGHLALGRGSRGLAFFGAVVLALLLLPWLRLAAALAAVVIAAVGAFDAALTPRSLARRPAWGKLLLVWAVIGALGYGGRRLYRATVIEAFRLPSRSMVPGLVDGDAFFVSKSAYGVRLGGRLLWRRPGPQRGDVVVFQHVDPRAAGDDPSKGTLLKRVVGVAGDRVEVKGGELFVNGVSARVNGPPVPCPVSAEDRAGEGPLVCHAEQLDSRRYLTAWSAQGERPSLTTAATVADDQVFVVGDHRDNSFDSRHFGPISIEAVKGRALVLLWSGASPRWRRIGTRLD